MVLREVEKSGTAFRYWGAIDEICERLNAGQMYLAEPLVRKLICRIFHYARIINAKTGQEHTPLSLKTTLDESYFDKYRRGLIEMAELSSFSRGTVAVAFQKLIDALFEEKTTSSKTVMDRLPAYFLDEPVTDQIQETERNVFIDPLRGRRIQFDTVHGVKGETHDATIYLETEMKGSSDIVRILPQLGIGRGSSSPLYNYSRKLVYVGMSRPKSLLCLAVQESTY